MPADAKQTAASKPPRDAHGYGECIDLGRGPDTPISTPEKIGADGSLVPRLPFIRGEAKG